MSRPVFRWRDAVLSADNTLPPTARLVALALSMHMDADTLANAFPGPALLARRTGLSLSAVKANLRVLIDAGWIEQTSRGGTTPGSSRRRASVYRGLPRTPPDPVQEKDGSGERRDPVQEKDDSRAAERHHLAIDLGKDLGAQPFASWPDGFALVKAENPALVRDTA